MQDLLAPPARCVPVGRSKGITAQDLLAPRVRRVPPSRQGDLRPSRLRGRGRSGGPRGPSCRRWWSTTRAGRAGARNRARSRGPGTPRSDRSGPLNSSTASAAISPSAWRTGGASLRSVATGSARHVSSRQRAAARTWALSVATTAGAGRVPRTAEDASARTQSRRSRAPARSSAVQSSSCASVSRVARRDRLSRSQAPRCAGSVRPSRRLPRTAYVALASSSGSGSPSSGAPPSIRSPMQHVLTLHRPCIREKHPCLLSNGRSRGLT